MYNIAVLVYNLLNNYNHTVVDGIVSYFEDKTDIRLLVAPVNVPHAQSDNYDYQYWSSVSLLKSRQIDGVILVPNSFSNYIDFEQLSTELGDFLGKPVVSIARPVNIPDSKYTLNTSESAYNQIVKHIKEKHNRSRIAFFTAGLLDVPESDERFESFKKALENNGLTFYPELVFEGDFTPGTAEAVLGRTIKSKSDLNFDAICCVNDFTAIGCIFLFDRLGISIPKDVIIFGYDDHDVSLKTIPKLSTINQNIPLTGTKAAELIYRMLLGEEVPECVVTDSLPVYRQSCGCVGLNVEGSVYYDWQENYHEFDENRKFAEISSIKNSQALLAEIYNMITLIDNKISLEDILSVIQPALKNSHFPAILATFYNEPVTLNREDTFIRPEKARVQLYTNADTGTVKLFPFGEGDEVELEQRIVPDFCKKSGEGLYYLYPIFMRDKNYGYIICKSTSRNYISTAINLKVIADILVNAYECSVSIQQREKLIENTMKLSLTAKTDELTKLFNRRGFMDYGQRFIEMSTLSEKTGGVFFFDLDGLKKINDTWGHETGDLAIKTEAKVLRAAFMESDLLGRLSGDEFAVISSGFMLEDVDEIRRRIIELNESFSKEAGLKFNLSISFGVAMFDSENTDLVELLAKADKQLYVEKEQKHRI